MIDSFSQVMRMVKQGVLVITSEGFPQAEVIEAHNPTVEQGLLKLGLSPSTNSIGDGTVADAIGLEAVERVIRLSQVFRWTLLTCSETKFWWLDWNVPGYDSDGVDAYCMGSFCKFGYEMRRRYPSDYLCAGLVFISACVAVYTSPKSMCLIAESRTSASPAFGHSNINLC